MQKRSLGVSLVFKEEGNVKVKLAKTFSTIKSKYNFATKCVRTMVKNLRSIISKIYKGREVYSGNWPF